MTKTIEGGPDATLSERMALELDGAVGTNKSDAADVMKLLVDDLTTPKSAGDITDVITHNRVVTQAHWQVINQAEVAAGEPVGKPRRKAVDREELLRLGRL